MLHVERAEQPPAVAPPAAAWVAGGVTLGVLLAAAAFAGEGLDRAGVELALRLTARLAFAAFWPCYVAGALVVLFGERFRALKRRARALGLAFAAVLAVHLGLVAALCAAGHAPAVRVFLLFGPGAACALLLAAASSPRAAHAVGPRGWWALRNVAMNYILFDFLIDFARREPLTSPRGLTLYLPFAALAAAALALRLAAALKPRLRSWSRA